MGKKKRLNRFITKWIKSDLPDDRSTVLLLGVTRIPTTPTPARRPCSLPLGTLSYSPFSQNHPINQHKSRKNSSRGIVRRNSSGSRREHPGQNLPVAGGSTHVKPTKRVAFGSQNFSVVSSPEPNLDSSGANSSSASDKRCSASCSNDVTPSNVNSDFTPGPNMDRSVDSIGACSLDADASVDLTDWSEQSSVGTLRSVSLPTPTPEPQPHLPSYLSLACTVSGYSTTTNYDPERLAKSRDASPHRLYDDLNSATPQNRNTPLYSIRNNLLSPPNVVPLPHHKYQTPDTPKNTMEEQLVSRREFYSSSTRTTSFMSKESRSFVTSMFSNDSVDGCIENGLNGQNKCVSFETKSMSYITNGSGKNVAESSYKEFSNGLENKSFIQQRVERLYGPGALAQGFFITKRQKNRVSESDSDKNTKSTVENDVHSKSMIEKLLNVSESENVLKQSASSPTLPVLRHLRPEFRAQLIISPKKGPSESLPKSITIPVLKEESETKINGHSKSPGKGDPHLNGNQNVIPKEEDKSDASVKDGHYFLKILDKEIQRLLAQAEKVEKVLAETTGLNEEITGKLLAASGKARLLTSQKMQQFKGLCTNNITQREGEAYPTTNEDLQGFWDMVLLQVDQVDQLFKEIDALKANNWEEDKPVDSVDKANLINGAATKPRKVINRARPTSAAAEEARKEREAKRKQMIEEKRKQMRAQMQKRKENIEIYVPESS